MKFKQVGDVEDFEAWLQRAFPNMATATPQGHASGGYGGRGSQRGAVSATGQHDSLEAGESLQLDGLREAS